MVVDDSAAIRARLIKLLRDVDGVEFVGEADTAAKALALSRVLHPELVILDLNLRASSGLEILPILKTSPSAPCVIVLTNHADEEYARHCRSIGADHFFDKSTEFQLAVEVVRSDVERRRAAYAERAQKS
jgi:two-component system, NarL family, response regulator DevR